MIIRTIIPSIAGTKYMSATYVGVGVGDAAACAADTTTADASADEP